ncbi:MAG: AAA family ATPase [Eubacterium sp.]|nr:AAA family ATPase [Eubacterium sp.]
MMKETIKAVLDKIEKINTDRCIVAIDGRCASGKSTLAKELSGILNCGVVHMDDFFLQPHQRTEERLSEIGGNIDYERFADEVICPLKRNEKFRYRPFNCHTLGFKEAKEIALTDVVIIEGAYSCHPKFDDVYDLKIFLDVDKAEQLKRIEKRNGKNQLSAFINKWIPLEERYLEAFGIKEKCDMIFQLEF